ncbi:MAG: 30S ribosomal protein S2 [Candidatus Taylorbacteria bacterium]|nr:30S ribosomal protein S2 [Candidatus Taylorbacteria bacterium]
MSNPIIDSMFKAGAHFGTSKSRRHPTAAPFIFGRKNQVEIFDLEKTIPLLEKAKSFLTSISKDGKQILLVGGKSEARDAIRNAGLTLALPFVDGRWIGGTLTNFGEIRKRMDKFTKLIDDRDKGLLTKYTKRERLMIDRQIANFERYFGGIVSMKELPKALFIVDPRKEKTAVKEAHDMGIPVVSVLGGDCNVKDALYPIVGNDASKSSIEFFVSEFVKAWNEGKLGK